MFVKIIHTDYDETREVFMMQITAIEKTKGFVRMVGGNVYCLTRDDMEKLIRMLEEE